jgi:hypothetical protein
MTAHARGRLSLLAVVLAVAALPAAALADVYTPARPGSLSRNTAAGAVRSDGAWETAADGPTGYARLVYAPRAPWGAGSEHRFGARLRLSPGRGYVNLLRADNFTLYGADGWHFGVDRYRGDGLGHLVVGPYDGDGQQIVGAPFALPTDRWIDLEVSITLGERIAVALDGRTVASGTFRAPAGRERITAVRCGVVATGDPGRFEVAVARMRIDD